MAFPKAPTKKVTGRLKISVRPPLEEVVGESETEQPNQAKGPDLASELNFKLPSGFKVSRDLTSVLQNQRDFVLEQLNELIRKKENCKNCDSAVSDSNVSLIRHSCLFVCSILAGKIESLPSLALNHSPNKDLTLNIRIGERYAKLLASGGEVTAGLYRSNQLKREVEQTDLNGVVTETINWFLEK